MYFQYISLILKHFSALDLTISQAKSVRIFCNSDRGLETINSTDSSNEYFLAKKERKWLRFIAIKHTYAQSYLEIQVSLRVHLPRILCSGRRNEEWTRGRGIGRPRASFDSRTEQRQPGCRWDWKCAQGVGQLEGWSSDDTRLLLVQLNQMASWRWWKMSVSPVKQLYLPCRRAA